MVPLRLPRGAYDVSGLVRSRKGPLLPRTQTGSGFPRAEAGGGGAGRTERGLNVLLGSVELKLVQEFRSTWCIEAECPWQVREKSFLSAPEGGEREQGWGQGTYLGG